MDLDDACPSRRALLRGLAGLGGAVLAPGVLVACSGGAGAPGPAATLTGSVPAAEVPVGTARVVDADGGRAVVAQPAEGEFVAFSARCTHQGTTVEPADGLLLRCPAHGSEFDAGDGAAVVSGPATEPLPGVPVSVEGDRLVLG